MKTILSSLLAVICFMETAGAGNYLTMISHEDFPNAKFKLAVQDENIRVRGGIAYWDVPDRLLDLVTSPQSTVELYAIGTDGEKSWIGDPVTVTDFNCTTPLRVPGRP